MRPALLLLSIVALLAGCQTPTHVSHSVELDKPGEHKVIDLDGWNHIDVRRTRQYRDGDRKNDVRWSTDQ